ncbi:type II toxin-antitoxin system HicA family toxin [Longimicrobium sp.]|uniref:type II toxin-antitoxin system HicA family toxin n=1 Tax=Longimicrobium sp. TaxID=2029185 RepID=UPI002E2F4800|nr:type II toxin-antitoxin system HicA family toxin [Longimicrobium sp.]HEX6037603.1 type II toxin-antitoxin system HicA family toxin [Longimicrobium sp.]
MFREPVSATIVWDDVEALFLHHGGVIEEGSGSRICMILKDHAADFHRPHPRKEAKRYQVRLARALLTQAGIVP